MDDIVITRNDEAKMKSLMAYHGKEFEIKDLGHFYFLFFGIKVGKSKKSFVIQSST